MITFPPLSKAFAALLNLATETNQQSDTTHIEGRSFAIAIDELPQDIGIKIVDGKAIELSDDEMSAADVTISGNIKAIINMIHDEETGLDSDELYVIGKISAAKKFQHFLASLTVDWYGFFNKFLPDSMASKTAGVVEQGIDITKDGAQKLSEHIKKCLLEDKKVVVTRPEFSEWQLEIKKLHSQLDTLLHQLH